MLVQGWFSGDRKNMNEGTVYGSVVNTSCSGSTTSNIYTDVYIYHSVMKQCTVYGPFKGNITYQINGTVYLERYGMNYCTGYVTITGT
jgi:hypothetical protein